MWLPPGGIGRLPSPDVVSGSRRYTYGKPVIGSVKADFCRNAHALYWYSSKRLKNICKTYQLTVRSPGPEVPSLLPSANSPPPPTFQTDKSGCASQSVNLTDFALYEHMYLNRFDVSAELEEFGTGGWARRAGWWGRFLLVLTRALWLVQGWF